MRKTKASIEAARTRAEIAKNKHDVKATPQIIATKTVGETTLQWCWFDRGARSGMTNKGGVVISVASHSKRVVRGHKSLATLKHDAMQAGATLLAAI